MFTSSVESLQFRDGHLDLTFRDPQVWEQFGEASTPGSLVLLPGDPISGPFVGLFTSPPIPEPIRFPTHVHRSDSFRVSVLGQLLMGRTLYGPGDFRLQQSGQFYAEGYGVSPSGAWTFLVQADRRGWIPTAAHAKDLPFAEGFTREMGAAINKYIPEVHPGDSKGIAGISTTLRGRFRAGHLDGSFTETASWDEAEYDTRFSVTALGDTNTGPIVITMKAASNTVVAPPVTYDTELLHCVITGSCSIGSKRYEAGDLRVQEAGVPQESIISGRDGFEHVIVISDRQGAEAVTLANKDADGWQFLEALNRAIANLL